MSTGILTYDSLTDENKERSLRTASLVTRLFKVSKRKQLAQQPKSDETSRKLRTLVWASGAVTAFGTTFLTLNPDTGLTVGLVGPFVFEAIKALDRFIGQSGSDPFADYVTLEKEAGRVIAAIPQSVNNRHWDEATLSSRWEEVNKKLAQTVEELEATFKEA